MLLEWWAHSTGMCSLTPFSPMLALQKCFRSIPPKGKRAHLWRNTLRASILKTQSGSLTQSTAPSPQEKVGIPSAAKSIRWVEACGECLSGEDGRPSRFVGVVVDITTQKNAQERQRLLAREADHRVKNIFANFHSMISLSSRSSRTPREMAEALRGRLDALLRAKDLIRPGIMGTEHESKHTTMDALVRTVLQPYEDGSPARIILNGPDVPVGAKAVTGLALALHETATNATKYGALSQPSGSVRVTWDASGD